MPEIYMDEYNARIEICKVGHCLHIRHNLCGSNPQSFEVKHRRGYLTGRLWPSRPREDNEVDRFLWL